VINNALIGVCEQKGGLAHATLALTGIGTDPPQPPASSFLLRRKASTVRAGM
jgi:hypothetical protein